MLVLVKYQDFLKSTKLYLNSCQIANHSSYYKFH